MQTLRVLVIDQDEDAGLEFGRLCGELGHSATLATSGSEALAYLGSLPLDAVFAHHRLPDTDILDLLSKLQQSWPQLQVVVFGPVEQRDQCLEALFHNACDVLDLPVQRRWLEAAFQRVAERRELHQLRQQAPAADATQLALKFAHAVNNPLASITGLVQLMLDTPDLSPTLREDLELLSESAARLGQVVRNLAQHQQHLP